MREYWIVDPYMKAVSVYLLRDGKYFLDDEYIDGLKVPLKYIFKWGYK